MGLLQELANQVNLEILRLLKVEPTYPRRLAALLGKKEQKIVPRLRRLEEAGLLKGSWRRVGGRNVKLYEVRADRMELLFGAGGLELVLHPEEKRQAITPLFYSAPRIEQDPYFVGREEELAVLASNAKIVVIEGMAGIGKTSLLQAFVSNLPGDNNIFWHVFKETDSFDYVIRKLATFLAELNYFDLLDYVRRDGKDDSVKVDLLMKGVDRAKQLLILEDYQRHHDEKIDSLLGHLQRHLSKAKILVASRLRPYFLSSAPNLTELTLEGLSKEESSQLLKKRGLKLKDEEIALVHEKTSGHPLALTLLCTIMKQDSQAIETLSKILPLQNLTEELLQSLIDDERELLIALSAFRDPIPIRGIMEVLKSRRILFTLHSLERKMILRKKDEAYLLHELIREGCYKLIDYPEELHKKIGEWYLSKQSTVEVLEGLYHLVKVRDTARVDQIMMRELFEESFRFVEEGFSRALLDILNPIGIDQLQPREACCLLCIEARALANLQKWRKAKSLLVKAKSIASSLNDPKMLACVYKTIAKYNIQRGDLGKAERFLLTSSNFLRKTGDPASLGRVYLDLARLYFTEGDLMASLKYVDLRQRIGTAGRTS